MKIGILLTSQPWWDQRHYYKQAPALTQAGHEVVLISDCPHQSDAFQTVTLSTKQKRNARKTGGLNLYQTLKKLHLDALQLCSIELLPLGFAIKATTRTKVIYDCREDMFYSMLHSKTRFPKIVRYILALCTYIMESVSAKLFDGIVVSDPALNKQFQKKTNKPICLFYNIPKLSHFRKDYSSLSQRKYDIVLLGGMTFRSGMGILCESLKELSRRGKCIKAILIGHPPEEELRHLQETCRICGEKLELTITGMVDYAQVPSLLKQAKIGLVLLLDLPKFHVNLACKIFEYMACGMPTITSDLPPEHLLIHEGVNGKYIPPGDSMALVNAIEELLDNIPYAEHLGENARQDFESQWNAEVNLIDYVNFWNHLDKKMSP